MKFSVSTATLLKTLAFHNELKWCHETENTLDLTSIKQLKGCRTTLVQDCLKAIQELDVLKDSDKNKKKFAFKEIKKLIQALEQYKISCERHPRLKDFLNIIPDNTSEMVCFIIIASVFFAYLVFSPAAAITLFIVSWALMDFFFNNRKAAKNLQEKLCKVKDELSIIGKADKILKIKVQATPTAVQTPSSTPPIPIPGSSSSSRDYSARFYSSYGSLENKPINQDQDETHDNQLSSSLSMT